MALQTPNPSPANWGLEFLSRLQWPLIVAVAFFVGRLVERMGERAKKAEKNVSDLITRHMPHIHTALSDIKSRLDAQWRK